VLSSSILKSEHNSLSGPKRGLCRARLTSGVDTAAFRQSNAYGLALLRVLQFDFSNARGDSHDTQCIAALALTPDPFPDGKGDTKRSSASYPPHPLSEPERGNSNRH
jgi:hypothetical protein